jgi:hypothetical protein
VNIDTKRAEAARKEPPKAALVSKPGKPAPRSSQARAKDGKMTCRYLRQR